MLKLLSGKYVAVNFRVEDQNDELLALLAQKGNSEAVETLLNRYGGLAKACSQSYFLSGADREDVLQESMIGLYKAVMSFESAKGASFKNFAMLCVKRQVISAVKSYAGQKHLPLSNYLSLYSEDVKLGSSYEQGNPETLMIEKEAVCVVKHRLNRILSPFEAEVLGYHLCGVSYSEIAERLGREPKSVDNALQRIKRKIEQMLLGC